MDNFFSLITFFLAPGLGLTVSLIYYIFSRPMQQIGSRLLVSAHGAVISLLYFGATQIGQLGASHSALGVPFMLSLLVPCALIGYSLLKFRGKKIIHILQLLNLFALFLTLFIGTMAITGEWL